MIKLGSKVRDSVTGFEGIATARCEFMYGCAQISITPQGLHEGKPIEHQFFDEQRVELVEEQAPPVSQESSAVSGGPQRTPPQRKTPGGLR